MLLTAALLMATGFNPTYPGPTLWLNAQGDILFEGEHVEPQINEGVDKIKTPFGFGYDFHGAKSGILFPDNTSFHFSKSFTVSAWINPRMYAPNGAQSQIFFRGDDRNGNDPYSFTITKNGTINFAIANDKDKGDTVVADIPLNQWTHVTASFNGTSGELAIWTDGVKVMSDITDLRPALDLVKSEHPGVGVGNVQNNTGPHNQPFNGMLADLRVYPKVMTPAEVGYRFKTVSAGGPQP